MTFWRSISTHGPKICMGDFNSRLYCRYAGEKDIIGPFAFFNPGEPKADSNRHLLMEFCAAYNLQIANTLQDQSSDKLDTYRELSTQPMDEITSTSFAQLDLCLIEKSWTYTILNIESCR